MPDTVGRLEISQKKKGAFWEIQSFKSSVDKDSNAFRYSNYESGKKKNCVMT